MTGNSVEACCGWLQLLRRFVVVLYPNGIGPVSSQSQYSVHRNDAK